MKIRNRRKNIIIFSALLVVLSICCIINECNKHDRLEEAQIAELRNDYPICGLEAPGMIDLVPLSLSEVKARAETFVYGEVIGEFDIYSTKLSTGNTALDEQRQENGIIDEYSFYEYTISVIADTEGILKKGEKITISDNAIFMDYNPKLSDGMKVVVPIMRRDNDVVNRAYYTTSGMFYVTDDEYVISVFDENTTTSKAKDLLSGVNVDVLLKKLKK